MYCELCGREAKELKRVWFEGAVILACSGCVSKYGLREAKVPPSVLRPTGEPKKTVPRRTFGVKVKRPFEEELVLVDDYGRLVREARERMGLTQEELAKKLGEKVSVIKKIETNKLIPTDRLVRDLERLLGISLREEE